MKFKTLSKLRPGDKVAIVSPSFAAPARWPLVYELGLSRIRNVFGLEPVALPSTAKLGASVADRSSDLIAAFSDPTIKAVIASLGGDDQVTYIKNLDPNIFISNPKPFFGYSDNSHFANFLWLNGIPSYYGGALFTEFAMQGAMDEYTIRYLHHAFFDEKRVILEASPKFNDIGLNWNDPSNLTQRRRYQTNNGWIWDGIESVTGVTWGGCLESIDEMLRHNILIPSLNELSEIVLFLETSEEIPSAEYVFRVIRGLGERGILARIKAVLMGRPKAWEFGNQKSDSEKEVYKTLQIKAVITAVRAYNSKAPIVQNMDFGHTSPQICLPNGRRIEITPPEASIIVEF